MENKKQLSNQQSQFESKPISKPRVEETESKTHLSHKENQKSKFQFAQSAKRTTPVQAKGDVQAKAGQSALVDGDPSSQGACPTEESMQRPQNSRQTKRATSGRGARPRRRPKAQALCAPHGPLQEEASIDLERVHSIDIQSAFHRQSRNTIILSDFLSFNEAGDGYLMGNKKNLRLLNMNKLATITLRKVAQLGGAYPTTKRIGRSGNEGLLLVDQRKIITQSTAASCNESQNLKSKRLVYDQSTWPSESVSVDAKRFRGDAWQRSVIGYVVSQENEQNYLKSDGRPQVLDPILEEELHAPAELGPFFDQCFDKSRLKKCLTRFFYESILTEDMTILSFLEALKDLGFEQATKAGISIGIDDLKIPPIKSRMLYSIQSELEKNQSAFARGGISALENFQNFIDIWHRTSEQLKAHVVTNFEATDTLNPVYMMAFSGARGNLSQVSQLVGMRGFMSDPEGQIIDYPIRSNFREGLTLTEYIISCYGARKGLVDTALRTADAGYLTRRLVDVAHQVVIRQRDCYTKYGIWLSSISDNSKTLYSLEKRLVGRVLAGNVYLKYLDEETNTKKLLAWSYFHKNKQIDVAHAKLLASFFKRVLVRSPLRCLKKTSLCQLCYGWTLPHGHLAPIGEAVGILAAQSIGEPGTQLTMRTFHTGGVFSGTLTEDILAPYSGFIEYNKTFKGSMFRTVGGKLAFLTNEPGVLKIRPAKGFTQRQGRGAASPGERRRRLTLNVEGQEQSGNVFTLELPSHSVLFFKHLQPVFAGDILMEFPKQQDNTEDSVLNTYTYYSKMAGFLEVEKTTLDPYQNYRLLTDEDLPKPDPFFEMAEYKNKNSQTFSITAGHVYKTSTFQSTLAKHGDLVNTRTLFNIGQLLNQGIKKHVFLRLPTSSLPEGRRAYSSFQISATPKARALKARALIQRLEAPSEASSRAQQAAASKTRALRARRPLKLPQVYASKDILTIPVSTVIYNSKVGYIFKTPGSWGAHKPQVSAKPRRGPSKRSWGMGFFMGTKESTKTHTSAFSGLSPWRHSAGYARTGLEPLGPSKAVRDKHPPSGEVSSQSKLSYILPALKQNDLQESQTGLKSPKPLSTHKLVTSTFPPLERGFLFSFNFSGGPSKPTRTGRRPVDQATPFRGPEGAPSSSSACGAFGRLALSKRTLQAPCELGRSSNSLWQSASSFQISASSFQHRAYLKAPSGALRALIPSRGRAGDLRSPAERPSKSADSKAYGKYFEGLEGPATVSPNFFFYFNEPRYTSFQIQLKKKKITRKNKKSSPTTKGKAQGRALPGKVALVVDQGPSVSLKTSGEMLFNYTAGALRSPTAGPSKRSWNSFFSPRKIDWTAGAPKGAKPKRTVVRLKRLPKLKALSANILPKRLPKLNATRALQETRGRRLRTPKITPNAEMLARMKPMHALRLKGALLKGAQKRTTPIEKVHPGVHSVAKALSMLKARCARSRHRHQASEAINTSWGPEGAVKPSGLETRGGWDQNTIISWQKKSTQVPLNTNLQARTRQDRILQDGFIIRRSLPIFSRKQLDSYCNFWLKYQAEKHPLTFYLTNGARSKFGANPKIRVKSKLMAKPAFVFPKNLKRGKYWQKTDIFILKQGWPYYSDSERPATSQRAWLRLPRSGGGEGLFMGTRLVVTDQERGPEGALRVPALRGPRFELARWSVNKKFYLAGQTSVDNIFFGEKATYGEYYFPKKPSTYGIDRLVSRKNCLSKQKQQEHALHWRICEFQNSFSIYLIQIGENHHVFGPKSMQCANTWNLALTGDNTIANFQKILITTQKTLHQQRARVRFAGHWRGTARSQPPANQQLQNLFFMQGLNKETATKTTRLRLASHRAWVQICPFLNHFFTFKKLPPMLRARVAGRLQAHSSGTLEGARQAASKRGAGLGLFHLVKKARISRRVNLVQFLIQDASRRWCPGTYGSLQSWHSHSSTLSWGAGGAPVKPSGLETRGGEGTSNAALTQAPGCGRPFKNHYAFSMLGLLNKQSYFKTFLPSQCWEGAFLKGDDPENKPLHAMYVVNNQKAVFGNNPLIQSFVSSPATGEMVEIFQLDSATKAGKPTVYHKDHKALSSLSQSLSFGQAINVDANSQHKNRTHTLEGVQAMVLTSRDTYRISTNFRSRLVRIGDILEYGCQVSTALVEGGERVGDLRSPALRSGARARRPKGARRQGQKTLHQEAGKVVLVTGKVIHVGKDYFQCQLIQKSFIPTNSRLFCHNGQLIEKATRIFSQSYSRLQMGDIVQGIPKIEEFFEARKTRKGEVFLENVHNRLKCRFDFYLHMRKYPRNIAARKSTYDIQEYIISSIFQLYNSQGINISDKHLEIIVRQMTSKVKVLYYPGHPKNLGRGGVDGFNIPPFYHPLPNELYSRQSMERYDVRHQHEAAPCLHYYRLRSVPAVLGITKAALQCKGFISAASFQETTRILTRGSIFHTQDFLKGLKENVVLGQIIPAGTATVMRQYCRKTYYHIIDDKFYNKLARIENRKGPGMDTIQRHLTFHLMSALKETQFFLKIQGQNVLIDDRSLHPPIAPSLTPTDQHEGLGHRPGNVSLSRHSWKQATRALPLASVEALSMPRVEDKATPHKPAPPSQTSSKAKSETESASRQSLLALRKKRDAEGKKPDRTDAIASQSLVVENPLETTPTALNRTRSLTNNSTQNLYGEFHGDFNKIIREFLLIKRALRKAERDLNAGSQKGPENDSRLLAQRAPFKDPNPPQSEGPAKALNAEAPHIKRIVPPKKPDLFELYQHVELVEEILAQADRIKGRQKSRFQQRLNPISYSLWEILRFFYYKIY